MAHDKVVKCIEAFLVKSEIWHIFIISSLIIPLLCPPLTISPDNSFLEETLITTNAEFNYTGQLNPSNITFILY